MDGDSSGPDKSREPVILGTELAAASAIEQVRLHSGPKTSPLAGIGYDLSVASIASPAFTQTPTDSHLRAFGDRCARSGVDELAEMRTALSMEDFYTLMSFAQRSLLLAFRSGDPSWPRSALNGLTAIAYERVDYRDLTLASGMVSHALDALGQDVSTAFRTASGRCGLGTSDVLSRFANQSGWTLAKCGYEVVGTGPETTLVRRRFKPYNPRSNLGSIARKIAVVIEADGLSVLSISIATNFPAVWLRGSPREVAAVAALDNATGCATIHTSGPDVERFSHLFVAFIVELQSAEDAAAVADAATESSMSHARLAAADGSVCAVLVSRSVAKEEPGLESSHSLRRFASELAAALRTGGDEQ